MAVENPKVNSRELRFLVALVGLYSLVMALVCLRKHNILLSAGFDLGIHDQGLWLLAQGKEPFTTLRGLPLTSDHFQPLVYPFSLLYQLPYPLECLLTAQAIWYGVAAFAIHGLCKLRALDGTVSLLLSALYLASPVLWYVNLFDVHINALALTPLMFALYFLESGKLIPYLLSLVLALSCGEAIGLQVVFLAVNATMLRSSRWGGLTLTLGAATLWVAQWATRSPGPESHSSAYLGLYSHLGSSPSEILLTIATEPIFVVEHFLRPEVLWSGAFLVLPLACLPLASPLRWVPALPVIAGNVLAWRESQHVVHYHYAATLLPFIFWAAVEGASLFHNKWGRVLQIRLSTALILVSLGLNFPHFGRMRHESQAKSLPKVAASVAISVDNHLAPHYSQRDGIYVFPNPILPMAWGAGLQPLVEQASKEIHPSTPSQLQRAVEWTDIERVLLLSSEATWPLFPVDRQVIVDELRRSSRFIERIENGVVSFEALVDPVPGRRMEVGFSMDAHGKMVVYSEVDPDGVQRLYLMDLEVGSTRALLPHALGNCYNPELSGDGKFLFFCSEASNLVSDDGNAVPDLYRLELATEKLERIAPPQKFSGKGSCFLPSSDYSGEKVVFLSYALGWDWGRGVFQYDFQVRALRRLDSEKFPNSALVAHLSPEGGRAAWAMAVAGEESLAIPSFYSRLEGGREETFENAWDFAMGRDRTVLVIRESPQRLENEEGEPLVSGIDGAAPNGDCVEPSLSNCGRFLAFTSYAGNLVAGDNNGLPDVFLYDFDDGSVKLISAETNGLSGNGPSYSPQVSDGGRKVIFVSQASNLASRSGRLILWEDGRCRVLR